MWSGGRNTLTMPDVGTTRTVVVRLLPNDVQEGELGRLANASTSLFNEVNYERRRRFFNKQKMDFKGTYKKYYEKYKGILKVNAQAVIQKNNEAWSSFFSLLKKGEKASPPGYWKRGGGRVLILVVRQDRYYVDVENHKLVLRDFKLEIPFAGRVRWFGKQGRLEIHYDDTRNRWYAYIPVEVGVTTTRTGKESKFIVKGERKGIQLYQPKGNKVASADLGINILASVVVNDGTWILYKSRAKEDYFYFQRRIAEVQSIVGKAKNAGELEAYEEARREEGRLYGKLYRRLLHLYRSFASHLMKTLYEMGVSTLIVGYPYLIAQDKGNKFTVNMWSYSKLFEAILLKAQEYGIKVMKVVEYNTSRVCAFHDVEVVRKPRGVISCPHGHKLHADLNGALNIMKLGVGIVINEVKNPLSFFIDHNQVAPTKGGNTQDPNETPTL
ncbi:RNA-guided endonuclease InsQ/TnpB family protein [Caldivirga maquilingensis]|uniref:Transposase n=1 Tax=Caldivirga maquilingensis (strain ATCC 700844 / DSM 13496 / JCM 10307 / IC-167) TaxID=397948 RepID=A8ME69_CALMQ|nr:Protein of unknown function DUF1225 [Caldivirga maquilingensis IC-167]